MRRSLPATGEPAESSEGNTRPPQQLLEPDEVAGRAGKLPVDAIGCLHPESEPANLEGSVSACEAYPAEAWSQDRVGLQRDHTVVAQRCQRVQ